MRNTWSFMLVLGLLAVEAQAELKKESVPSKISSVTLYRSQALVVRTITVPQEPGEYALTVDQLPPSVVVGSLFASSSQVRIRSVQYLTELVPVDIPTDAIAQIEKQQSDLLAKQAILARKKVQLASHAGYLDNLEKQYLARLGPLTTDSKDGRVATGFDFGSIAEMTKFLQAQRESGTQQALALDDEERSIAETDRRLRTQLQALRHEGPLQQAQQGEQGDRRTLRKAVIYITKEKAGEATFLLNYLVNNAGWSPAYNIDLVKDGKVLALEYLAHVRQVSGEDWSGVRLTLSTAAPNMNAEIPILAPLTVHLTPSLRDARSSFGFAPNENENPLAQIVQGQQAANSAFQTQLQSEDMTEGNLKLNLNAWNRQAVEFGSGGAMLRQWNKEIRKLEAQMAVEYPIAGTVTLISRNDNQMVQILNAELPCSLYYEAVPILASYVSRGVEARNIVEQPLLDGRYSAFINGRYVGAGSLPVTATGQTLILGLGIDPQLRCRRELIDKIADKAWGSRTEVYRYRMLLDNYKDIPVQVRLLDRFPVTKDKGLDITLKVGQGQLCADEDYRAQDYPKGILRWDLEVPAGSSGAKTLKFEYAYDLRFDSDMQIAAQDDASRAVLRGSLLEIQERRKK